MKILERVKSLQLSGAGFVAAGRGARAPKATITARPQIRYDDPTRCCHQAQLSSAS